MLFWIALVACIVGFIIMCATCYEHEVLGAISGVIAGIGAIIVFFSLFIFPVRVYRR